MQRRHRAASLNIFIGRTTLHLRRVEGKQERGERMLATNLNLYWSSGLLKHPILSLAGDTVWMLEYRVETPAYFALLPVPVPVCKLGAGCWMISNTSSSSLPPSQISRLGNNSAVSTRTRTKISWQSQTSSQDSGWRMGTIQLSALKEWRWAIWDLAAADGDDYEQFKA